MMLFYAVHYPKPEYQDLLLDDMHEFGNLLREQPGCIWVNPHPFKNPADGSLMAISIWESVEALQEAGSAVSAVRPPSPFDVWEYKDHETFLLPSAR